MKLKEVFPNWKTGAIFAALAGRNVPWVNTVQGITLDLDYFGNYSGNKITSNLIDNIIPSDGTITPTETAILCDVILGLYLTKWAKLWATMSLDYNPIENYSMREEMTNDETVTEYGKSTTRTDNLTHRKTGTETADIDSTDRRTDNLTHGKTGTETRTDNLTDTTTPNITTNTENSVYGFNSVTAVPADEQEQTATGTNTETHTGTEQKQYNLSETDAGTQTTVTDGTNETTFNTTDTDTGTQTVLDGGSDTHTRNYVLTRSGNIGVTTSQQMIESERELWRLWNFFRDIVYPDIDRVLTIEIY